MTDSQDWWPADWGPLTAVCSSHGLAQRRPTYRNRGWPVAVGAPANQRFCLRSTSWPDNGNLARPGGCPLPIKQKYGNPPLLADLIVLNGQTVPRVMGFPTFGFGGGRVAICNPGGNIYWATETSWMGDALPQRRKRELEKPPSPLCRMG